MDLRLTSQRHRHQNIKQSILSSNGGKTHGKSFNPSTPKDSIPCKKTVVSQKGTGNNNILNFKESGINKQLPFQQSISRCSVVTGPDKEGRQLDSLPRCCCEPMGGAPGLFPCRGQDGATGLGLKLWLQKHPCAAWQHCGYFQFLFSKKLKHELGQRLVLTHNEESVAAGLPAFVTFLLHRLLLQFYVLTSRFLLIHVNINIILCSI